MAVMKKLSVVIALSVLSSCSTSSIKPVDVSRTVSKMPASVTKLLERETGGKYVSYTFTKNHFWVAFGDAVEVYSLPAHELVKAITFAKQNLYVYNTGLNVNYCIVASDSGMLRCFNDKDFIEKWCQNFSPEQFEYCKYFDSKSECFDFSGTTYSIISDLLLSDCLIVNMEDGSKKYMDDVYRYEFIASNSNIAAFNRLIPDLVGGTGDYYIVEYRDKNLELMWTDETNNTHPINPIQLEMDPNLLIAPNNKDWGNNLVFMRMGKNSKIERFEYEKSCGVILDKSENQLYYGIVMNSSVHEATVSIVRQDALTQKIIWKSENLSVNLYQDGYASYFKLIYDKDRKQVLLFSEACLYSLNARDGKIKWSRNLVNNLDSYACREDGSFFYLDGKFFYSVEDKNRTKTGMVLDTKQNNELNQLGMVPEHEYRGMIYSFTNGIKRLNPSKWGVIETLDTRLELYGQATYLFLNNYKLFPLFIFAGRYLAIGGKNKIIADLVEWKVLPANFFDFDAKFENAINPEKIRPELIKEQPFFENQILVARGMVVGGKETDEHIGDSIFQLWSLK